MRVEKSKKGYNIYLNNKTKKPLFIPLDLVDNERLVYEFAELYVESTHKNKISVYKGLPYCVYFYKVWQLTEQNSHLVYGIELRGKEYHLDHIVPIIYGFDKGISAMLISSPANLQMLKAKENLIKRQTITEEGIKLLKKWNSNG